MSFIKGRTLAVVADQNWAKAWKDESMYFPKKISGNKIMP